MDHVIKQLIRQFCKMFSLSISKFLSYSGETEAATKGVLWKKGALRKSAKFVGKHLCRSLFFNKDLGLRLNINERFNMIEFKLN